MITEHGIITRADTQTAWVRTTRTGACKACEARGTCETAAHRKEMHVAVRNTLNVKTGDQVVIGMESGPLLYLSFLLYVFPVILLLIGIFIGNRMAPAAGIDPSLSAIGTGLVFFGIAFAILRRKNSRLSDQSRFRPVLVRKTSSPPLPTCHS